MNYFFVFCRDLRLPIEQCDLKPLLVDYYWGLYYPLYIGDFFIIQERGIFMNQPVFQGIRKGFCKVLNCTKFQGDLNHKTNSYAH